jgi:hypothetical protein
LRAGLSGIELFLPAAHGVIDESILPYNDVLRQKTAGGNFMKRTKIQRVTALLLCLIFVASCFSVNTLAADGAAGESGGGSSGSNDQENSYLGLSTSDMLELLETISYTDYLLEYSGVTPATDVVTIDAVNSVLAEKSDVDVTANVGEYDGETALLTPGTGSVTWKVTVPKTAKYTIKIEYYAVDDGKASSIERIFRINGKVPFSEARYLTIKKNWVNDYVDAIYNGDESKATLKTEADKAGIEYYEDAAGKLCFKYPEVWTSAITKFCELYEIRFFKLDINKNELRPTAKQ